MPDQETAAVGVAVMIGTIVFTYEKYRALKQQYEQALKDGKEEFTFEGHLLLVAYAKYLLEYLELQLKESPK